LKSNETRDWRPLILLAVLVSHFVVVSYVTRAARLTISSPNGTYEPLILMLLPHRESATDTASKTFAPDSPPPRHPMTSEPVPDPAISPPDAPIAPPNTPLTQTWTDWEHEAELAAHNGVAAADRESKYRNLSGLSPDQLAWTKRNHMEPVPPGIPWAHPRIEYTEGGLPIIWVNDHCVVVPMMMFLMFCKVGHIEANGDLFKHMHDPREP
jgi:hypothetical protein